MSTEMMMFDSNTNLPAHLAGQNLGVLKDLLATVGAGGNRIGLKGSRFRVVVNGKEEAVRDENYLDVIIVGVVPHISRMYYEGEYQAGDKAKPTCFSVDGSAPPEDLPTKQASKCDGCKWNEKGSKVQNGMKMKACGFFQRLVVMLAGDDSGNMYRLDVKSQGLFGESHPKVNKFNVRDYAKFVANRGVEVATIVTRLTFDTDSSVPKLLFGPARFVTEAEFVTVKEAVASEEVKKLLEISMNTVDLSGETSSDDDEAPTQQAEVVTPASKQTAVAESTPEVAKAVAEEAAAPVQQAAPTEQKRQYKPVPEKLGEFTVQEYLDQGWTKEDLLAEGMIIDVTPEPVKAAPPKPPAKPAGPPKPPAKATAPAVVENVAMPTEAKPAPKAPPKPTTAAAASAPVQEVANDAELADLIAGLI